MKHFISLQDLPSVAKTVELARQLKQQPYEFAQLGSHKMLGLLFFNQSLRTRLSTQKAAQNLGLASSVLNFLNEAWSLEFNDGSVMNANKTEHIKEAAKVMAQYCDVIAVRCFAKLQNKTEDLAETTINAFKQYSGVPIVNMETATGHPLQALADAMTIAEHNTKPKPKIVMTWAPHCKALPHAVANSFIDIMRYQNADFVIANPPGYNLDAETTKGFSITHNQDEALAGADFVYAKNWSSYQDYGKILCTDSSWMITTDKMQLTDNAKFMHCLPIRRNLVATDAVLESKQSIVIEQANNRTFAAQAVLKLILDNNA